MLLESSERHTFYHTPLSGTSKTTPPSACNYGAEQPRTRMGSRHLGGSLEHLARCGLGSRRYGRIALPRLGSSITVLLCGQSTLRAFTFYKLNKPHTTDFCYNTWRKANQTWLLQSATYRCCLAKRRHALSARRKRMPAIAAASTFPPSAKFGAISRRPTPNASRNSGNPANGLSERQVRTRSAHPKDRRRLRSVQLHTRLMFFDLMQITPATPAPATV